MDPLAAFLEISQFSGPIEEARERLNAAGGNVEIALEHLYSNFDLDLPPKPLITPPIKNIAKTIESGPVYYKLNQTFAFLFDKIGIGYSKSQISADFYSFRSAFLKTQKGVFLNQPSFNKALSFCKNELKFLLVGIHTGTPVFPDFNETLNYSVNALSFEGTQILMKYNIKSPCVLLVAPCPKNTSSEMVVLAKCSGTPKSNEETILKAISKHQTKLNKLKLIKTEQKQSRQILSQQNSAFQESLQKDQQKQALKQKQLQFKHSALRQAKRINQTEPKVGTILVKCASFNFTLKLPSKTTFTDLYCLVYAELHKEEVEDGEINLNAEMFEFSLVSPVLRRRVFGEEEVKSVAELWPRGVLMCEE